MRVSLQQIAWRGLTCRCPNCGGQLILGSWLRLPDRCPQPGCNMRWQRSNGFYLGAMVWNYGVTVFGLLSLVLLAAKRGWVSPHAAVVLALAIALVFPWIFYKLSWSLWLASYYFFLPHELPANDPGLDSTDD